jgi:hypothetical protein
VPDLDRVALAERLYESLGKDDYGFAAHIITSGSEALGVEGRAKLRELLKAEIRRLPKRTGVPLGGRDRGSHRTLQPGALSFLASGFDSGRRMRPSDEQYNYLLGTEPHGADRIGPNWP